MRVVEELPPLYPEILKAFPAVARLKPIFSWGATIYNPHRIAIDDGFMVHEGVHAMRQSDNPEAWWRRYISDAPFRLEEEFLAHLAEYRWRISAARNRHERRALLVQIAARLSSPLYGSMISLRSAKKALASVN
jgi:hypothetical protein